jgi:hypothetical protein
MRVDRLRTLLVRACASLVLTAIPAVASAGIIFTDGFGDGDRDNNGTAEAPVTDSTDVGVPWFYAGGGTSAATLAAIDDSAGIGNGNALQLFNSGSNNRPIAAQFTPTTLNDGDKIVMRFDARAVSTSAVADRNFRFGLYNNGGTFINGDQGSTDTSYQDDVGYLSRVDVGADTSNTTTMDVTRDDSATGTVIGGTATSLSITTTNAANQITDNAKHHFELTLTRSGTGLAITLQEDGNPLISGTDATPVGGFTFNEAMLTARSNAATDYRFDNIQVEYLPFVPEPSSIAAISLVATGLLAKRRNRRG